MHGILASSELFWAVDRGLHGYMRSKAAISPYDSQYIKSTVYATFLAFFLSGYYQKPDEQVVQKVQGDLEELRVTVRGNDPNWLRTGSLVTLLTSASLLAPFLLSELLTEVIVPLAGTVLTVFVVYTESEARSAVACAKTRAAQINAPWATKVEGMPFKAPLRLL